MSTMGAGIMAWALSAPAASLEAARWVNARLLTCLTIACTPVAAMAAPVDGGSGFRVRLDLGHDWRPPFGLDRIGRPIAAVVDSGARPEAKKYWLAAFWKGQELGRQPVAFTKKPPYSVKVNFDGVVSADALVLTAESEGDPKPFELARQPVTLPELEADAVARVNEIVNPIDLGAILIPKDWLLLGPRQRAAVEVAALSRKRELPEGQVKAWFDSAPARVAASPIGLRGGPARSTLVVPEVPSAPARDALSIVLEADGGQTLWRKTIPVMRVSDPLQHPVFGATYERLRYDAPISIRDPATGAFSSMPYEQGWPPELRDVVVWLPNGGRFVFWRGSSYIPFWAGEHNTAACYEWAEIISQPAGAVDCVEPLMDKELRYGRVEIVESTAARVHVRWRYQSTDFNYKVWGDEAVEDYYFYRDGFGTRVVNLKSDPANDYELSEFIILTPQGAYPFEVLPEVPVDAIELPGDTHHLRFPGPNGDPSTSAPRLAGGRPAIYRLRLSQRDRLAAVFYSPQENAQPPMVFGPFFDAGLLVTPCYWGSHWPLARGNSTGRTIDDRIRFTPCHNSVMTWAGRRPAPLETAAHVTLDALGRARPMIMRRWAWLIGMTDAPDPRLREWASSYTTPPALEVHGGRLDFRGYAPERRAIRLAVDAREIEIALQPASPCVNPVFELAGAPRGEVNVTLDGHVLDGSHHAWDGHTLWLDATIKTPARLRVTFGTGDGGKLP
jgi:hypothetical protein